MTGLNGRVAIVTGAARGLGRGYALRLAALGAKVAVVDQSLVSYQEFEAERQAMTAGSTVEEIQRAGGVAAGYELDVTDPAALEKMADSVAGAWGRIDILVANAGGAVGTSGSSRASELDPPDLDLVMRRNFYGTVYSVRAVAPIMKRQRGGRIITVGSIAGLVPDPAGSLAHYGAAKAAVAMYTKYLAQELAEYGITCNCVAPGVIATGRIAATVANRVDVDSIPARRVGTVDDVTALVEFLAADGSGYITGAVIPVDGGRGRGA
jgi:3-oxoacyl-[acyl-carrier protein] reductase